MEIGGKIPNYFYKQMMQNMIKDWNKDGYDAKLFDSWKVAGFPNVEEVNEIIW